MTSYPISIDGFSQLPVLVDGVSPVKANNVNALRESIIAVETELGTVPSGTFGTVKDRLGALEVAGGLVDGYLPATMISILDVDGYYTGTNVEEALIEIGAGGVGGSVGTITGSGTLNQVAYFSGTTALTSDAGFTYDGTTFGVDRAAVFNEGGANVDFRVEGVGRANLLRVQAAAARVGINRGAGAAGATLDVDNGAVGESVLILRDNGTSVLTVADGGSITHEGGAVFNEAGAAVDFRVEGVTEPNLLFVDASTNRVGIGTPTPGDEFHIVKNANSSTNIIVENSTNSVTAGVQVVLSTASGFASFGAFPSNYTTGGAYLANKSVWYNQTLTGGMLFGDAPVGGGGIDFTTSATPSASISRLHIKSTAETVFNEPGNDWDLRVEGNTRPNLFFLDAGQDRIGINRTTGNVGATIDIDNLAVAEPILILRDNGTAVMTVADGGGLTHEGGAVFNEAGAAVDFRVEGDTEPNLIHVNAGTDTVAFGTAAAAGQRITVMGPAQLFAGSRTIMNMQDNTTAAAGVGAGIQIGGRYHNAGTFSNFATVWTELKVLDSRGARLVWGAHGNNNDNNINEQMSMDGVTGHLGIGLAGVDASARLDVDNEVAAAPILILRDNGTQVLAIPDAMGASVVGEQLCANDATGTLEWSGPNNPTRVVSHYDDFFMYKTDSWWDETVTGAGAIAASTPGATLGDAAAGVLNLGTGTTATGASRIQMDAFDGLDDYDKFVFEARVRFEDLSTVTEEFLAIIGSFGPNGAYFSYDRTLSTSWRASTISASTATTVAVGSPIVADTWYNLKWIYDPATPSIEFFLDGVSVTTSATNIPDGAGIALDSIRTSITKSVGTTARSMYVDFISFYGYLNADR